MSDVTAGDRASGDFERYGLLAALTLVVLSLLLVDRLRSAPAAVAAPPADRLLRVRIGGAPQRLSGQASAAATASTAAAAVPGTRTPHPAAAPAAAAVAAPAPAPPAPRSCVVAEGETLGDIALRELGTSKRAREIADLNGVANVHQVRVGQTLKLPPR